MKLKLAAAFGIGYVLGARAGRERYEEIRRAADRVQSDPRVREAADRAESFAREAAHKIQDDDRIADVASQAREAGQQAKERAVQTVAQARETLQDHADDAPESAKEKIQEVHEAAQAAASDDTSGSGAWPPHPDEHVGEVEDEVVYSTGPDKP